MDAPSLFLFLSNVTLFFPSVLFPQSFWVEFQVESAVLLFSMVSEEGETTALPQ